LCLLDQRKPMTVSERVALANAIAERLQGRQLANLKQNRSGNISGSDESGDTRDIAATKAGLGSGKTLEAAQRVVEHGALLPRNVAGTQRKKARNSPSLRAYYALTFF
jgi:hypothetical protein